MMRVAGLDIEHLPAADAAWTIIEWIDQSDPADPEDQDWAERDRTRRVRVVERWRDLGNAVGLIAPDDFGHEVTGEVIADQWARVLSWD